MTVHFDERTFRIDLRFARMAADHVAAPRTPDEMLLREVAAVAACAIAVVPRRAWTARPGSLP